MNEKQSTKSNRGGKRENAGRPAGVPNKLSGTVKDNVVQVFEDIGGLSFMATWAKENPNQFFNIYAKLLPLQLQGNGDNGEIEHSITVKLV
jgi:hypothetical protein